MSKITLASLQKQIDSIKSRNGNVEAEKAWEISLYRKVSLILITFIACLVVMYFLEIEDFVIWAFLSTFGYLLSTLSLSFLKKKYIYKYMEKGGKKPNNTYYLLL